MTTLVIKNYDEASNSAAIVFIDSNCTGKSVAFFAGSPGVVRNYNISDMSHLSMSNDAISSIMVPYSTYLTLYQDDGNRGNSVFVDGAERHNAPNQLLKCYDIQNIFSDRTSSLSVTQKKGGAAIGEWRNAGSATGSLKASI